MKKLGFGFVRLPELVESNGKRKVDLEQVKKMVDLCMEHGFTYFDTAYMYHEFKSELYLKEALVKRYPREQFQVANKLPLLFLRKEGDMEEIFDEQLRKCNVTFFDYYLLHNVNETFLQTAEKFDCFGFLKRMKEQGKIHQIGFSFHDSAELLEEILIKHPEVDFVQLQINYVDWDNMSIQSKACFDVANKYNKPIIAMESLKSGSLAHVPDMIQNIFEQVHPEWSPASWAIRFAASQPGVMLVLSGMSSMDHLMDNIDFMDEFEPMGDKEEMVIDLATVILREIREIPCTGCGECVASCAKNIPIPYYFALYNSEKVSSDAAVTTNSIYYGNYSQKGGKASECLGCKKCEKSCPNHLTIAEFMKQVAMTFETPGERY